MPSSLPMVVLKRLMRVSVALPAMPLLGCHQVMVTTSKGWFSLSGRAKSCDSATRQTVSNKSGRFMVISRKSVRTRSPVLVCAER